MTTTMEHAMTAASHPSSYLWLIPFLPFFGFLINGLSGRKLKSTKVVDFFALGSVGVARDPNTKLALASSPRFTEQPPGNSTNAFNLVNIDWLTGRARVERQEVR